MHARLGRGTGSTELLPLLDASAGGRVSLAASPQLRPKSTQHWSTQPTTANKAAATCNSACLRSEALPAVCHSHPLVQPCQDGGGPRGLQVGERPKTRRVQPPHDGLWHGMQGSGIDVHLVALCCGVGLREATQASTAAKALRHASQSAANTPDKGSACQHAVVPCLSASLPITAAETVGTGATSTPHKQVHTPGLMRGSCSSSGSRWGPSIPRQGCLEVVAQTGSRSRPVAIIWTARQRQMPWNQHWIYTGKPRHPRSHFLFPPPVPTLTRLASRWAASKNCRTALGRSPAG